MILHDSHRRWPLSSSVILVAGPEAQRRRHSATAAAVAARDGAMLAAPDQRPAARRAFDDHRRREPITRVSLDHAGHRRRDGHRTDQLLIHGKQPGTISMFVWDQHGAITTYEVVVRRDLSSLVEQMQAPVPQ